MAAPLMGDGAPAEGDARTEDDRDEADDEVEDSAGVVVRRKHPQKSRNSCMQTMMICTTQNWKQLFLASWGVELPGGTGT
jgi:predicted Zn-dependent protease